MAGNAAAIAGVDEVESGLGLGAAEHLGLCEHEVKVGTDGVDKGEGCESADVRFGAAHMLVLGRWCNSVGWRGLGRGS